MPAWLAMSCEKSLDVSTAAPLFRDGSKSSEVLYITMALIGLLVVCVFVIAGLVLIVAKRRREGTGALFIAIIALRRHKKYILDCGQSKVSILANYVLLFSPMTRWTDEDILKFSKWAPAAILDLAQPEVAPLEFGSSVPDCLS